MKQKWHMHCKSLQIIYKDPDIKYTAGFETHLRNKAKNGPLRIDTLKRFLAIRHSECEKIYKQYTDSYSKE